MQPIQIMLAPPKEKMVAKVDKSQIPRDWKPVVIGKVVEDDELPQQNMPD